MCQLCLLCSHRVFLARSCGLVVQIGVMVRAGGCGGGTCGVYATLRRPEFFRTITAILASPRIFQVRKDYRRFSTYYCISKCDWHTILS